MLCPSPAVQNLQDPSGILYAHADELKGYLQTALQGASRLEHSETYQQTIQDILDQLDQIVGEDLKKKNCAVVVLRVSFSSLC